MTPLNTYLLIVQDAIPYAVTFALGNLIVSTCLNAMFRGRLDF